MADGTRARVMEESLKGVQGDQKVMRQELNMVVTAISSLQTSINELIKRSESGYGKKPIGGKNDGESEGSGILGRHKPAPVVLPRFKGENTSRWISQANRYFEFYKILEKDRLIIASFYLDDTAADWFNWLQRRKQISTWEAFTDALLKRFSLSNRTMPLPVKFLINCWISGLRSDIKQSVICHQPTTLEDAMDKAQLHERRIQFERGLGWIILGSSKPLLPTPKTQTPDATSLTASLPKTTPANSTISKDSTESGSSSDGPSSVGKDSILAEQLQLEEVKTTSAISYNALAGGCSSTTLRFTGTVQGKYVQVLLDGGTTHCFVQTRIANFLNFAIEVSEPFSVLVGSGERLPCSGLARAVELLIQGHSIVVDFYVLPLQGWDMVLGVSWLATLGPVITDYSKSLFEFSLNRLPVKWQGDVSNAQVI
ncbi:hypothetical protein E3N88_08918 [Mikania micrantha]|uniref:Retrotransposon gag domain-containing protein n=1 Tax=Mikania micrantha TaxID=192012 RepID=A0A5N6PI79_9ASTR|nr:hypothetical protein E3N88_08918 [Mikania micrantha]